MPKRPYDAAIWPKLRQFVLERDNYECRIQLPGCKKRAVTADHIVPYLQGGAWFEPLNLRAACTPCNVRRSNGKEPEDPLPLGPSRDW